MGGLNKGTHRGLFSQSFKDVVRSPSAVDACGIYIHAQLDHVMSETNKKREREIHVWCPNDYIH